MSVVVKKWEIVDKPVDNGDNPVKQNQIAKFIVLLKK